MSSDIDNQLEQIGPRNPAAMVCNALFGVLPHVDPLAEASTVAALAERLHPGAPAAVVARAQVIAGEDASRKAIWMATGLDAGDGVVTIFTSIKSALALYSSRKTGAATPPSGWSETQGLDATLKSLAICHLLDRLFPGEADPLLILLHLETGRALLAYMATVEVSLPFLTESVSPEGQLARLVARHGAEAAEKLGTVVGAPAVAAAQQRMPVVVALLDRIARDAASAVVPAASALERSLPVGLRVLDMGGDVFAAGADVLPNYRYLGVRLVAEAAALQALREAGLPVAAASAAAATWQGLFLQPAAAEAPAPADPAPPTPSAVSVAPPPISPVAPPITPVAPPILDLPEVAETPTVQGGEGPALALGGLAAAGALGVAAASRRPSAPPPPPVEVAPPPPPVEPVRPPLPPLPVGNPPPPMESARPVTPPLPPLPPLPEAGRPASLPTINPPPPPIASTLPHTDPVRPAVPKMPPLPPEPPRTAAMPVMPPLPPNKPATEASKPPLPVMPPLPEPKRADPPTPAKVDPPRASPPPILQLPPETLQPTYTREEPVVIPEKRGLSMMGIVFAVIVLGALGCAVLGAFGVGTGLYTAADSKPPVSTDKGKPDSKKNDTKKNDTKKNDTKKNDQRGGREREKAGKRTPGGNREEERRGGGR